MPMASWEVPFSLTSLLYSASPLALNTSVGGNLYLLRPDGCSLGPTIRATKEDVPQSHGSILHPRFLTGTEMLLTIQLWDNNIPACDEPAQEMLDNLMGYLVHLLNAGDNDGRISWTPSGETSPTGDRMLDDIRLLTYPEQTLAEGGIIEVEFTLDTRFPYSMKLQEDVYNLAAGANNLINTGTMDTFPVFKLNGPFTTRTLVNTTTGVQWKYDATLPGAAAVGGGDYIEIDTFRNTVFLNGDEDNMMAGVDVLTSEFFPLIVGSNIVTLSAGTGQALVNPAYA